MWRIATILVFAIALSGPAHASDQLVAPLVVRLETEGFTISEVRRTLLGRILITSQNEKHLREVVLNRHTGEILRDRLFPLSAQRPRPFSADAPGTAPTKATSSETGKTPGHSGQGGEAGSGGSGNGNGDGGGGNGNGGGGGNGNGGT